MAIKKTSQTKLDHHHFGASPDDPSFDLDRARAAHADVMARWDDPEEGDDFKGQLMMAIQNATAAQIEAHRPQIQRFLDEFARKQTQTVGKAIVRTYVSEMVGAAQEINKKKHPWHEQDWKRNHGQFSSFIGDLGTGGYTTPHRLHAQALAQAANIAAVAGMGTQQVQSQIADKKGNVRLVVHHASERPKTKRGETIIGMRGAGLAGAGNTDALNMGGHVFNLVQALGAGQDRAAQYGRTAQAGMNFGQEWDAHANKHYGDETGKSYARIGSASRALNLIAGNSPKAQVAAAVGHLVGAHGSEAEKVLGPHARKSAYKYRGVQRAPRDLPTNKATGEQEGHDKLVARLSRHIPTRSVHNLNLASGYTAPSHGYLLNPKGKVHAEAHGYGDDHYLPFKLSGLHKLKNGSYIRTRSTGGPTTEDIYAAGVSGAKSFTVASRQGTYTVAFDDEFTHDKRFGDIALGMGKRYGKILDAVNSGKVRAHGEVTDAQFDDFYQGARKEAEEAGITDVEAHAMKKANAMRTAQEGKEGRELTLDGEGYDYALQSLASQYPYYLHYRRRGPNDKAEQDKGDPTGYFRPSDPRFHDVDKTGGHLERIGNRGETDRGYVKARHLKSADALVGYYDPEIAGETKDAHGNPTGTGKVKGNQAYYQNWGHNAYNPKNRRSSAPSTPAAGPGAPALGVTPQGTPPGQRSGEGRQNTVSGWDEAAQHNMSRIKALREAGDNHHVIAGWANDPEEMLAAHQGKSGKFLPGDKKWDSAAVDDFLQDREAKHNIKAGGLTNQRARGDETPDAVNAAMDAHEQDANQSYVDVLTAHLDHPDQQGIRDAVIASAAKLKDGGHQDLGDVDLSPENSWAHYDALNAARDDVLGGMSEQGKAAATNLEAKEQKLDVLEANLGLQPHERWHPGKEAIEEDQGASAAAAADAATPEDKASEAARDHHAQLGAALSHLLSQANTMRNSSDEDLRIMGERYKGALTNAAGEVEDNGPDVAANTAVLRRLLEDHEELGDVDTGNGHKLKDLHMNITKNWTVRKSGSRWIIRQAA